MTCGLNAGRQSERNGRFAALLLLHRRLQIPQLQLLGALMHGEPAYPKPYTLST